MKTTAILSTITGFIALSAAAPASKKCEVGSTWCDGTSVMTCTPKARSQVLQKCPAEETCVSPGRSAPHCARTDGAVINDNAPQCEAGAVYCDGDRLMTCSENRILSVSDDCSARNEICSAPGRSAPHCSLPAPQEVNNEWTCSTPGGIFCVDERVIACGADFASTTIEDCNLTGEYCISPGRSVPHCSTEKIWISPIFENEQPETEFVCEPGATFCLDEQVFECGQDRSHNLIEDCNRNQEYCVRPGKSAPHCAKTKVWISFPEAE